jgi:hypothetical protein
MSRRAAGVALAVGALVASTAPGTAQMAGFDYVGTVENVFVDDGSGGRQVRFDSNALITVSEDGRFVTGRAVASSEGVSEFGGQTSTACLTIEISFLSEPLPIENGRAEGDVRMVLTLAGGSCADPVDPASEEQRVPFFIEWQDGDTIAVGRTEFNVVPGGPFRFTAGVTRRPNQRTTTTEEQATGADDDIQIPGIDELFLGSGLTDATRNRLGELQGCRRRNRAGTCVLEVEDRQAFSGFLENVRDDFRLDLLLSTQTVSIAGMLAGLRDANRELIIPSMRRMLPVIVELRRQAEARNDASFDTAARRLIGLLVTQALEAREDGTTPS